MWWTRICNDAGDKQPGPRRISGHGAGPVDEPPRRESGAVGRAHREERERRGRVPGEIQRVAVGGECRALSRAERAYSVTDLPESNVHHWHARRLRIADRLREQNRAIAARGTDHVAPFSAGDRIRCAGAGVAGLEREE